MSAGMAWRKGKWVDIEEFMDQYRPQLVDADVWVRLRPHVINWVDSSQPATAHSAKIRMRVTINFTLWCLDNGLTLDVEQLFTEERVEAWIHSGEVTPQAKGTYRSHLRQVAKANAKKAIWTPTPAEVPRRDQTQVPYTPAEVDAFRRLIDVQATERRSRVADIIVHLGLAFGLTSSEMFDATINDFPITDDLVTITLEDRTVPALTPYDTEIRRLLTTATTTRLLGDHIGEHKKFDRLIRLVEVPARLPKLEVRRLRTTWMVTLLSSGNVNVREFQYLAGHKSSRSLDYLVPALTFDEATLMARGARH